MAMLPYVLDDMFDAPVNRYSFGVGLHPSELSLLPSARNLLASNANPARYMRPWGNLNLSKLDGAEKKMQIDKDGFQVCLDVQHFAPNEISVKVVDDSIVVEAKHEERQDDHGYISRQFTRRYDLPKGFRASDVMSTLSSDGVLTVKAPTATAAADNVRHVQIQHTGPAHLTVEKKKKDEKSMQKKDEKMCK